MKIDTKGIMIGAEVSQKPCYITDPLVDLILHISALQPQNHPNFPRNSQKTSENLRGPLRNARSVPRTPLGFGMVLALLLQEVYQTRWYGTCITLSGPQITTKKLHFCLDIRISQW
jgi:hypothetical protein